MLHYDFVFLHNFSTLKRKVIVSYSYRSGLIEIAIASYNYRSGLVIIIITSYSYRSKLIKSLSLLTIMLLTVFT